jgi:acyl-coenzyme A thioesterase PaaI-like protein
VNGVSGQAAVPASLAAVPTAAAALPGQPPAAGFSAASKVRSLGDGTFTADLPPDWTVGNRPHGGFLLALLSRTALQVAASAGGSDGAGSEALDPLAVSAQFLRSPEIGPVLLRTELRKFGRTAAVIAVNLEQRGRSCVESMITVGRMAEDTAVWTDLPDLPAKPPTDALDLASVPGANAFRLSRTCEVRLDQANTGFLHGRAGDPLRLRMWARPRGEHPDVLFGLVAGDISMPVTLNLGRYGWSPTVQLTALLRGRPAPGWLRIEVSCRAVHGQWFDEDATVIDSAGRLICQARQLALTPIDRPQGSG